VVSDEPKIPLVRKRHTETLIVTIRYFYTFLLILNEFSVREHRATFGEFAGRTRTVAATVAAPSTVIPAFRSTRAASVRLLPVVTKSSTRTAALVEIGLRIRNAPERLSRRATALNPA
jgi:ABC-type Fe2+-enterobactin transport system substrate-binding protein